MTTGFLLIWFGLNRIVTGNVPALVSQSVDLEGMATDWIGVAAGAGQVAVGACCALGLFRLVMLPLQALINGATAVRVWWAILDPFRWYIEGVDRIVFNSQVFYPASITFAACLLLIAFRSEDRWALDTLLFRRAASRSAP
ncbi:MAG: hypothetical protein R3F55_10015 [Alphaproteobacteria bacterium]